MNLRNELEPISLPQPDKVDNITKDELLEIVRRVKDFDENGISDFFASQGIPFAGVLNDYYYIPLLEKNFDYSDVSDLFDCYELNGKYFEYSIEEIATKIINYDK